MKKSFEVVLSERTTANVFSVDRTVELSVALHELGLDTQQRRVLVVVGGASKLTQQDFDQVQRLFVEVLAPIAQKWQACVIDGGTDAGVMRLMGHARTQIEGTFPLIGVAPLGLATLPNQIPTAEDAAPLEPNHTHFLLVPGSQWGDDSPWIAEVASELAHKASSVTVLVNGGEIAWKDAFQSVQADRSVIVISGSGRTADSLAAALRGELSDVRAEQLIASGLVQAVDLTEKTEVLAEMIEAIFANKR